MADRQISIRITKDLPDADAMDRAAAELGISKNQLVTEGIKMMCTWDKVFYSKMKAYAEGLGVSMAQVMQNFLIKRLADDAAEETVWGDAPRALLEFTMTTKGLVTGKELFEMLYADKVNQLFKERARQIQQTIDNDKSGVVGATLSDEDKEVLKKYGNA